MVCLIRVFSSSGPISCPMVCRQFVCFLRPDKIEPLLPKGASLGKHVCAWYHYLFDLGVRSDWRTGDDNPSPYGLSSAPYPRQQHCEVYRIFSTIGIFSEPSACEGHPPRSSICTFSVLQNVRLEEDVLAKGGIVHRAFNQPRERGPKHLSFGELNSESHTAQD